jgi:hypothetical protein
MVPSRILLYFPEHGVDIRRHSSLALLVLLRYIAEHTMPATDTITQSTTATSR